MKFNIEPLKKWFGFSRRERRATCILLIIIFIVLIIRYSVPASNINIEYVLTGYSGIENNSGIIPDEIRPFKFDPNTASYDTLVRVGLASKEANTLIKYRNSGGKFRSPSDIKKIYGIDVKQAERIIPFVEVKPDTSGKVRISHFQSERPLLDLNSCDSASLDRLPGIGPVLSSRIIKYRQLLGGFVSIDQLKEVYGLPLETFDIIKGRVFADSSAIIKTKINSADYKKLSRLPYLEKYEVSAILKYRELKGNITNITDLIDNKLITKEKASKVGSYLRFD